MPWQLPSSRNEDNDGAPGTEALCRIPHSWLSIDGRYHNTEAHNDNQHGWGKRKASNGKKVTRVSAR